MSDQAEHTGDGLIILYDAHCNLCQGITRFVIQRDPKAKFRFASLQSNTGKQLLTLGGLSSDEWDTFVMIDNGKYYTKSTAALRTCRSLGGLWALLYGGIIIPPFIRNRIYDFVAKRRYRWFGHHDSCLIPTENIRKRFMEDSHE